MFTRRDFLGGAAGISVASLGIAMPRLFAQAARESALTDKNDHVLVVIELAGGNDGLNTAIPFENALYYKNRRTLGIPKDKVLKVSDQIGLHPQMGAAAELFKEGRIALLQGVGYPDPDRSHFRSMEIWHTASLAKRAPAAGWLGRFLDETHRPGAVDDLRGLALSGTLPQALQAESTTAPVVTQLEAFADAKDRKVLNDALAKTAPKTAGPLKFLRSQADALYRTADRLKEATDKYKSTIEYPEGGLGSQLRRAAQIIAGNLGTRVLFASQDGYDTHAGQAGEHGHLLEHLSLSLAAFQKDLAALGVADKVVVTAFSEFGRRVDENASAGTDHGAASCMFLVGSKVKGGLLGQYPSLEKLGDGDLIHSTDFRSVYATLLERWLGCPAEKTLGANFPLLNLFA